MYSGPPRSSWKVLCGFSLLSWWVDEEVIATDTAFAHVLRERISKRLKKVQRSLETPCWEFQGAKDKDGYGKIRVGSSIDRAHRVTYSIYHGLVPDGHVVRHRCDNPPCCNPAHLETGTHEENMQDMVERGRHVGNAKLNFDQVTAIRRSRLRGVSIASLAARYGVSESTISAAAGGQNWHESLDFLEE